MDACGPFPAPLCAPEPLCYQSSFYVPQKPGYLRPPVCIAACLCATTQHEVLTNMKCGRTDLKRKVHLLDVPSHKVGKEKDQTPKQSSNICMETHAVATHPITLPS